MTSIELIIESNARKKMARYGFKRKFDGLNYLELDFYGSNSLNSLYTNHLRSSSKK